MFQTQHVAAIGTIIFENIKKIGRAIFEIESDWPTVSYAIIAHLGQLSTIRGSRRMERVSLDFQYVLHIRKSSQ
jgi:hypothetical protein